MSQGYQPAERVGAAPVPVRAPRPRYPCPMSASAAGWGPDVLGRGYEQLRLPLTPDEPEEPGEVVATLVRRLPRGLFPRRSLRGVDVLYVHGWSDYFFQRRLGDYFAARGARFYALDLRRYGRSLRPGQLHGYVRSLRTYDEEIAAALAAMGPRRGRRLVLVGHSTGGLVLSLWAARHPGVASALILNSPWLEFQLGRLGRAAISPALELGARLRPRERIAPTVDLGFYWRAQQEVAVENDPTDPNPEWRPAQAPPPTMGWLDAVLDGHREVAAGLAIPVPVLVLLSTHSALPRRWSETLAAADTVLAVDEVARAALNLGTSVTVERIEGALHDVFLSRSAARERAYARLDRWVSGYL